MYTFADRSDRSLTLRPEATAPICRAYVEHGFHREPQPAKLFTIATMYRYGAPGRGRHREHWQASVEAIGSDDPSVDAELIQLYDYLLRRLGLTQYHLELNSIGCRECRPAYLEALRNWLDANAERLDEATREKAATSPLRVFDDYQTKPERPRRAGRSAEDRRVALRRHASSALRRRPRDLDATGVPYVIDPTLVRGLDYYIAHDIRVRRAGRERQLDDLRRWPLRRSGRDDRRSTDAGDRIRRRPRAPAPRARERGHRARSLHRSTSSSPSTGDRASASHVARRATATRASRRTSTMRAARSRAS